MGDIRVKKKKTMFNQLFNLRALNNIWIFFLDNTIEWFTIHLTNKKYHKL